MGESTPCYPPVMGEFKKGWWIPPNPQQEKTLLHLELPLTPSLTKRGKKCRVGLTKCNQPFILQWQAESSRLDLFNDLFEVFPAL